MSGQNTNRIKLEEDKLLEFTLTHNRCYQNVFKIPRTEHKRYPYHLFMPCQIRYSQATYISWSRVFGPFHGITRKAILSHGFQKIGKNNSQGRWVDWRQIWKNWKDEKRKLSGTSRFDEILEHFETWESWNKFQTTTTKTMICPIYLFQSIPF